MSIPPPPGPHQPEGPYQPPQQGPYGPPSYPQGPQNPYGPYQPWAQGYSPYNRPAPVNGLAVTSLVLGVLCCIPGAGLVLGLIALGQIRRRGERGKGLAVGGSVLSGIGLALWALVLATGGGSDFWDGFKDGARDGASISLAKGECFNAPAGDLSGETYDVDTVPCTGEHDGEVFASFRLTGGGYPGDDSVTGTADKRCYGLQDSYAMDAWAVPDDVDVYYLTPTEDSWSAGDREVTCVFGSAAEGGNLTGSLRNDQTVLDADQVAYLKAAHVLNAALESAPDAKYVEDDLPGHKAWAGRVSAALAEQARMLRGHRWPAGAREPVAILAADLDVARKDWVKAAKAKDADVFYQYYGVGLDWLDPKEGVNARKALGLETTPPSRDSGGSGDRGGSGNGGGDGGSGDGGGDRLEV
ncbi:hypothetical protein AQI88_32615 [Streptomyces cellostaticus]|uniref:DUF4190 domain-containing protein n=1 Tax=Streptomyces cellostaticus TaxID=67285 RepID=A0A101NFM4_9ACTN|nr:DUF4190 domain-containing protein [Streptomyces cellostaticus]KUM92398.1 hypothetical protein AQI88_32615 [Streptomyces cellostaticus]GHI05235.1 membrane protein [Streptomyces cellostaticus]